MFPVRVADAGLLLDDVADVVDVTIKARWVVVDVSHVNHQRRHVVKLVIEHSIAQMVFAGALQGSHNGLLMCARCFT